MLDSRQATPLEALTGPPEAFRHAPLPTLVDRKGRSISYARLSVTDRCDLRCTYCMPEGGEEEHETQSGLLSATELGRLIRLLAKMGVRRFRLTGGEPLVRKDILELVCAAGEVTEPRGLALAMTTNATRLASFASKFAAAGLGSVNISLDSIDAERFREITRGGSLEKVMLGIDAALAAGLEVKLNSVLLPENLAEVPALVAFAWDRGITPRFIERMPLGLDTEAAPVSMANALAVLGDAFGGLNEPDAHHGPARYVANERGQRIGFITPITEEFCGTCNRLRISSKGDLRACLAWRNATNLRDAMRRGADDHELAWGILQALAQKRDGHAFLDQSEHEHRNVGMSLIGG